MGRKTEEKLFNLILIATEYTPLIKSQVPFQSSHLAFMVWGACECVTGWRGPVARWGLLFLIFTTLSSSL